MKAFSAVLNRIVAGIFMGIELAVFSDLTIAFYGEELPIWAFVLIAVLGTALPILFSRSAKKQWSMVFGIAGLYLAYAAALVLVLWAYVSKADYDVEDFGKSALFSDREILVFAPHQDDEINIAGGVIEEYIKYGSKVSIAYYTNGDFKDQGLVRQQEALEATALMGISEEDVYFLGYGDRCTTRRYHIYNAPEDMVVPSVPGYTHTYGLEDHPPYRNGREYTRINIVEDIKAIILELRPDIIFCNSVEGHFDHSALSLFVDEAMGQILCEQSEYTPLVLKSSCYATAYYSENDFHTPNIKATVNPLGNPYYVDVFDWEGRLRLPVNGESLSHSVYGSKAYKVISEHRSQDADVQADRIINGDKVFWIRDTSSLSYMAKFMVSSGNHEFLKDFKTHDGNVFSQNDLSGNTWIPDEDDKEKTVFVEFAKPCSIRRIHLYDDPNPENNVLNALIKFDDGSVVETGPLKANGAVNVFDVEKDNVAGFSVQLLLCSNEHSGLTEIEVFDEKADYGFDFIKVQTLDGDFVYDYYTQAKGEEEFVIYRNGNVGTEFNLSVDNKKCSATMDGDKILVKCPSGEKCKITVQSSDGEFSDTVTISNPGRFMRETGRELEQIVRLFRPENMHRSTMYRIYRMIVYGE